MVALVNHRERDRLHPGVRGFDIAQGLHAGHAHRGARQELAVPVGIHMQAHYLPLDVIRAYEPVGYGLPVERQGQLADEFLPVSHDDGRAVVGLEDMA